MNGSLPKKSNSYSTSSGVKINIQYEKLSIKESTQNIINKIDFCKGALFSSSYEYPNRYSRWDVGFVNPPIEIRTIEKDFEIKALNERGRVILAPIYLKLKNAPEIKEINRNENMIKGTIIESEKYFEEEKRSKQPTVFSMIRSIKEVFYHKDEKYLGLYGAFGYDLVFQFEPMKYKNKREPGQADMVLFLPDDLVVVDHQLSTAYNIKYDFEYNGACTEGLPFACDGDVVYDVEIGKNMEIPELKLGNYADVVREAIEAFKKGDLFEVVASQTIYKKCNIMPSKIFKRLKAINPSPYGFIINMGTEFLVGSSPEMFVRVDDKRVETCPISGTIKRGKNAIEDSVQIKKLLNSYKDESELTMCTDVDRNDKSRICVPGSVKVIGRRQIEMYSHLIHTVDHVEGYLRDEYDSLDAFLSHMWAVTVTGAPKRAAIKWLENKEDSARKWYGGAIGFMSFNGNLNTGLTLRTFRLKDGIAEIRVGATLLYDSIPEDEEAETYVKAEALLASISRNIEDDDLEIDKVDKMGQGIKILFVDHEDSFVHTLANYFRQTGAEVIVLRNVPACKRLQNEKFDMVMLSPGPGCPDEFNLKKTIGICVDNNIPVFGVCLGLQGIVEYFGGNLGQLDYPQHGKPAVVNVSEESVLWEGLGKSFNVGRYHSLYANDVPDVLKVTARTDDGVVMAVEHKHLPIMAVQFHPESILALENNTGMKIIENVIKFITGTVKK